MLWANVLPGITVDSFVAAMLASIILAVVNTIVRPIVTLLTLPLTLLTLGLFLLVINVAMIALAAFLTPGFRVDGFLTILIFGLLLAITHGAIDAALSKKD